MQGSQLRKRECMIKGRYGSALEWSTVCQKWEYIHQHVSGRKGTHSSLACGPLTVKEKVALLWLLAIRKEPTAGVSEPLTSPGWASAGGSPATHVTMTSPRVPTLATTNSTLRADTPSEEEDITFNSGGNKYEQQ